MSNIEKDIAEYSKKKRQKYFRAWRDKNREHYREYQREYKRKRRESVVRRSNNSTDAVFEEDNKHGH